MLTRHTRPFCGGSLLGNKWIVTAAHCLHRQLELEDSVLGTSDILSLSDFKVILGKHSTLKKDDTEQHLYAKKIIFHPSYQATTFENDLALVELSEQAVLNDYVMPICLPDGPQQEGTMVLVSGWGKQFLHNLPVSLMEIEVPIVDHNTCQEAYATLQRKVSEDMICAGEKEGGKDACSGDSGGPMVTLNKQRTRWHLVSTVSWGDGCGKKDRYGVYSNIHWNLAWIQKVTGIQN